MPLALSDTIHISWCYIYIYMYIYQHPFQWSHGAHQEHCQFAGLQIDLVPKLEIFFFLKSRIFSLPVELLAAEWPSSTLTGAGYFHHYLYSFYLAAEWPSSTLY